MKAVSFCASASLTHLEVQAQLDGFGKYSATLRSSSEGRGGQAVSITIGQQL